MYVNWMLTEFTGEVADDCNEMEASETGWRFKSILRFDVRRIYINFNNIVGLGAKKPVIQLHPSIKSQTRLNLRDPNVYLRRNENDLCVPASVILCLEATLNRSHLSRMTFSDLRRKMYCLRFASLISPLRRGVLIQDLHLIEAVNNPFPTSLLLHYPSLRRYPLGLAVNVYRIHRMNSKTYGTTFTIFPKKLSKSWRKVMEKFASRNIGFHKTNAARSKLGRSVSLPYYYLCF